MNDKAADVYVDAWITFVEEEQKVRGHEGVRRALRLLVKEVERDTRHKCADMTLELASRISNLEW